MADASHASFHSDGRIEVAPKMVLLFKGLALCAVIAATLLAVGTILFWLTIEPDEVRQMIELGPEVSPDITMGQRIAAALVGLMTTLPLAWGFLRLRVCLASFAAGRPFASQGIAGLRDFAIGGLLAALGRFLGHTLMSLVLTWTATPGHRQLAASIDADTLLLAMFAASIAALVWAMEKAAAIAEENRQFV